MNGIIFINAYSQNQDYLYQSKRLCAELTALGVNVSVVRNYTSCAGVNQDGSVFSHLKGDFCVYFDKDKYVARLLEKTGMRLFNRASAVEVCDDKMSTHIALSGNGIACPKSISAPFCYTSQGEVDDEYVDRLVKELSLPLVVKHSYGSLGKEVYLAESRERVRELAQALRFTPHLYQQYIKSSYGKDLRIIAVGGEIVGGMVRSSNGDFRSNMALGGTATPYACDERLRSLAKKISYLLQLDYCGIDLLFTPEGWCVCEVNSNAFFQGMERTTGINVAKAYAEYIVKNVK